MIFFINDLVLDIIVFNGFFAVEDIQIMFPQAHRMHCKPLIDEFNMWNRMCYDREVEFGRCKQLNYKQVQEFHWDAMKDIFGRIGPQMV